MRISPVFSLTVALGLAAAAAACSASTSAGESSASADTTADAGVATPMPPIETAVNPQIVATLAAAGLTVDNLPADLDAIKNDPNHAKLHAVMKSFTIALGVGCDGCHVKTDAGPMGMDFDAATPRKNVAKKMWSEFVAKLSKKDGSAIYCDTCHEGKAVFLDRVTPHAIGPWMKANFVAGLERKDGTPQECNACHGDPFNGSFLDQWELGDPPAADAGTP
jgi:hypothetical protein